MQRVQNINKITGTVKYPGKSTHPDLQETEHNNRNR